MKTDNLIRKMDYVYMVVIAGNLLALTGDTTLTWSSPVLPKLNSNNSYANPLGRPITQTEESWVGSLQYVGAIIGILPFSYLADRIGRKPVLLILSIPHIVSFIVFAFAKSIGWFYLGRFLGGISLSSVYVILPMYVAEISENTNRGLLLVSYSTFASFGDLFPYILGPYVSILCFNLILCIFPLIFFVSFFYLAPESPYYQVNRNDYKAAESLTILRGRRFNYDINDEIELIKNEKAHNTTENIWEILKKKYVVVGFMISLGLSSFQQLSGLGAILAYTQYIFSAAGGNFSAEVSSIIVGVVLFLASFCGPLIVDKKGRKFLLICSTSGCMLAELILGFYFYFLDNAKISPNTLRWLPVLCLIVFFFAFNIGLGPLPYTITSEILPSNLKFGFATLTSLTGWVFSFLITKFFNDLNNSLGKSGTFWLFSFFCGAALLFVISIVPETKGRSFQEIQLLLNK